MNTSGEINSKINDGPRFPPPAAEGGRGGGDDDDDDTAHFLSEGPRGSPERAASQDRGSGGETRQDGGGQRRLVGEERRGRELGDGSSNYIIPTKSNW